MTISVKEQRGNFMSASMTKTLTDRQTDTSPNGREREVVATSSSSMGSFPTSGFVIMILFKCAVFN